MERKRDKTTVFLPLDPQPDKKSVFVVRRNYAKSKLDPTYCRKVTWISECEKPIACIEYKGTSPGHAPHGNSEPSSRDYVRTKSKVMETIKENVKQSAPKEVYENNSRKLYY